MKSFLIVLIMVMPLNLVAIHVHRQLDVSYNPGATDSSDVGQRLDIYYNNGAAPRRVIVFVHGGSWSNGDKHTYRFMAKRLVRRGFIAVMVNYRLAPRVGYAEMARDCAMATDWVYRNIASYGGDPEQIILAGHSAGGHLVALAHLRTMKDMDIDVPVKKMLLIDPFGLDMLTYFQQYDNNYSRGLFKVFGDQPAKWKAASPLYAIEGNVTIPVLTLVGGRTYEAITTSSNAFHEAILSHHGVSELQTIRRKKHVAMIVQFFFGGTKTYNRIIPFLKS